MELIYGLILAMVLTGIVQFWTLHKQANRLNVMLVTLDNIEVSSVAAANELESLRQTLTLATKKAQERKEDAQKRMAARLNG